MKKTKVVQVLMLSIFLLLNACGQSEINLEKLLEIAEPSPEFIVTNQPKMLFPPLKFEYFELTLQSKNDAVTLEKITVNRNDLCIPLMDDIVKNLFDKTVGETPSSLAKSIAIAQIPFMQSTFRVEFPLVANDRYVGATMQFGDKVVLISECSPLELVLKTDKGDVLYTW